MNRKDFAHRWITRNRNILWFIIALCLIWTLWEWAPRLFYRKVRVQANALDYEVLRLLFPHASMGDMDVVRMWYRDGSAGILYHVMIPLKVVEDDDEWRDPDPWMFADNEVVRRINFLVSEARMARVGDGCRSYCKKTQYTVREAAYKKEREDDGSGWIERESISFLAILKERGTHVECYVMADTRLALVIKEPELYHVKDPKDATAKEPRG